MGRVLARAQVTLVVAVDVASVTTYYRLQSSMSQPPSKPTVANPDGWDPIEPEYDSTSTQTLYTCVRTMLSDGTYMWSSVSKSTAYEASKEAINAASAAQRTAEAAYDVTQIYRYDHSYTKANGVYTFTAQLFKGDVDVTQLVDPDRFVWWLRTEDGDTLWAHGVTMTISDEQAGYRASILGGVEETLDGELVDANRSRIVTSDGYGTSVSAGLEL